jgi:hypothetical protein
LAKTRFDDRGAGRRFASKTDKDADSGALDGEALSFIMAWDDAQRQKGRMLSKSEVFQVVYGVLGYRLPVVAKPKRRRGRAFRLFCARCECNLSHVEEIVQYQSENYCPACEPFIEKRDDWAEAEWSS